MMRTRFDRAAFLAMTLLFLLVVIGSNSSTPADSIAAHPRFAARADGIRAEEERALAARAWGMPRADVIIGTTAHTGKYVALTFDDGPDPVWTPRVLDLLAAYRAQATFCVVGQLVREHPHLVRRIASEGHALCDHTSTHDSKLPYRSRSVIWREINGCLRAVLDAAPWVKVPYFRPAGGSFSEPDAEVSVQKIAAGLGMQPLGWSIDTLDWTDPGVPEIVSSVKDQITSGDVVLMHDSGGDRSQTIAALRVLLPWLVSSGYRFDVPRVVRARP